MKGNLVAAIFKSESFRQYDDLLRRLHSLEQAGKGEGEEAEDVRDRMDTPFRQLSQTERDDFRALSASLYAHRTTKGAGTDTDILSSDVEIQGSIAFGKELLINGKVEGEISSDGMLIVGEQADIRGEIRTKSITIYGKVQGNVTVGERCELKSHCTLLGDVKAGRLIIEEGATFIGTSVMISVGGANESPRETVQRKPVQSPATEDSVAAHTRG